MNEEVSLLLVSCGAGACSGTDRVCQADPNAGPQAPSGTGAGTRGEADTHTSTSTKTGMAQADKVHFEFGGHG